MQGLALRELEQQAHYVQASKKLYENKYLESERQLASLVQTQVVETQRALELLKAVWVELEATIATFCEIESECQQCQGLLGKEFDAVLKISRASKNLAMTGAVQQLFQQIPQRALAIGRVLRSQPDDAKTLVTVYEQIVQLFELKEKAVARGDAYMSALGTSTREHFVALGNLRVELEKQIRLNVSDALYLGIEMPALMVATLIVCVKEDTRREQKLKPVLSATKTEWDKWRHEAMCEDTAADASTEDDAVDDDVAADSCKSPMHKLKRAHTITSAQMRKLQVSMKEKVLHELEQWITTTILEGTGSLQSADSGSSAVDSSSPVSGGGLQSVKSFTLQIDRFMDDLELIVKQVHLCFPPDYFVLQFMVEMYLRCLSAPIFSRLNSGDVKTQDRLQVVKWMSAFRLKVEALSRSIAHATSRAEGGTRPPPAIVAILKHVSFQQSELLESYIAHCEEKLKGWMANIVLNEKKKHEAREVRGVPRTHCPQDVFTSLNPQFEVTLATLRGDDCVEGLRMIVRCVAHFKQLLADDIAANYRHFTDDYLCALVNSCVDIGSKLKDRIEPVTLSFADYGLSYEQMEALEDEYDEMTRELTLLATDCVGYLVETLIADALQENVFDQLFTADWFQEGDSNSGLMASLVQTLDEYHNDFEKWLAEGLFYRRFCERMCTAVVNSYVNALLRQKPKTSTTALTDRMEHDQKRLTDFYSDIRFEEVAEFTKSQVRLLESTRMCFDPETYDLFGQQFEADVRKLERGADVLKLVSKLKPAREDRSASEISSFGSAAQQSRAKVKEKFGSLFKS